jgi:hypothetical protein
MTQIAGPETLPDTMRRFANNEGGPMWRENKVPTFVLKKTFVLDEGIQRAVTFTASRTFDDPGQGFLGTQYDWEEADQRKIQGSELPDYVVEAVEMDDDVLHNPDNIFTFSQNKTVGLYVPTTNRLDEGVNGLIISDQCIEYAINGDMFCGLPVIGGKVFFDPGESGALQRYRHQPAYGLQVIQFARVGEDPGDEAGMDELELMLHGSGSAALVNKCSEQILGMMEFLRPPVDEVDRA